MIDRDIGLACPLPEGTADVPAMGKIRVEHQGTVNQRHHGAGILAEKG